MGCKIWGEARLPLLLLNNNDPGFCTLLFAPHILDLIFFQGHKPTHVFKLRIVGADWLGEYVQSKSCALLIPRVLQLPLKENFFFLVWVTSSGQTLYETTSGGRKFSECSDLKFSTKVQNAASNLLLLHTMLYLSRHQFKFAIKANIFLFLLSQFATKGTYLKI